MWHQLSRLVFVILVFADAFQLSATPPQLDISPGAPQQVTLSWQDTNNWLQSASRLFPGSWVNVGATPTNNGGTSSLNVPTTDPARFFRLVTSPQLPPPTRLVVGVTYSGIFLLEWDPVPGAASYRVYRATVPGVNNANYGSLPGGAAVTGITDNYLSVAGLTPGTRYYFVVTAVAPAAAESANSNEASDIYGPHADIFGEVFTEVTAATNAVNVSVPGVTLTLSNISGSPVSSQLSDLDGLFSFDNQPAGTYELCWRAPGFISSCATQSITISNLSLRLNPIQLYPVSSNGVLYGKVTFADGTSVAQVDSFFDINITPSVALKTNNSLIRVAPLNSLGEYVMPGVPLAAGLDLSAAVQNTSITTNVSTFVSGEANLVVPNSPPVIFAMVATYNGQPAYRVPPGATVQVDVFAADADGDPLTYRWYTPAGPASYPSSASVSWTLPNDPDGFHYLFVRVSDGKGGYATERISLTTSLALTFSGFVTGSDLQVVPDGFGGYLTNAPALSNAIVQLNDVITNADGNGYFSLQVTATNEYELFITCSNYMPMLKILFDETLDQEYRLLRISADPCTNDSLVDSVIANPQGVTLKISAGTLFDTNGFPYSGLYRVGLDSRDPCSADGLFAGGNFTTNDAALVPFGFVNITVTDCGGAPLYLGASTNAELFVPMSVACYSPSAPAATPFFTLSPFMNRWDFLASAMLTNTGYLGRIPVFGPVAPATTKATGALLITADRSLHVPFTIGIFETNGIHLIQYLDISYQTALDDTNGPSTNIVGQVVNRLRTGDVLIKLIDLRESPGEFYLQGINIPTDLKTIVQIVTNTVAANTTNLVVLGLGVKDGRQAQLAALTEQVASNLKFLGKRSPKGSIDPSDPNSVFNQYYALIDPQTNKDSFLKWQLANGWSINVAGIGSFLGPNAGTNDDAFAIYFNSTELGAGRRMGMKINGANVAYYVATYATLADAEAGKNLKYIVCMEYSPHPTLDVTNSYVKFYAFGPNGARTGIVPDEDRHRPTYVPYVCMVCHGGGKFQPEDTLADSQGGSISLRKGDTDGMFVAFDTANYTFSHANGFNRTALFQNNTFSNLNAGLLKSEPIMPKGLVSLITNLMVKGYTTSPLPGWETDADSVATHNKSYAVSCRSCHSTQSGYTYGTAATFQDSGYGATPTKQSMPQTQRMYSIFWGSATGNKIDTNTFNQAKAASGKDTKFK